MREHARVTKGAERGRIFAECANILVTKGAKRWGGGGGHTRVTKGAESGVDEGGEDTRVIEGAESGAGGAEILELQKGRRVGWSGEGGY